jgi:hypothetical protein
VAVLGAVFTTMTLLAGAAAQVGAALWAAAGAALDVGSAIIDGLMSFDPSAFVEKMAGMASAGLAAFKRVLGIKSPSKVMEQMGGYIDEGAGKGVDRGSKAQAAAGRLGARMAGGASGGLARGAGGGKSVTLHVAPGALVINAGGATVTDEGLAIALERLAVAMGG